MEKQDEKIPVVDFKAKDWYVSKVDGKIHNIYHSVDNVEPKFDVGHEYYSELLKNDKSDTIGDYAYQCVYCMSHDWTLENPTWDDVQNACKFGAKWQKKHDVSGDWSEEDEETMSELLSFLLINAPEQWAKYGKWLKSIKQRIGG